MKDEPASPSGEDGLNDLLSSWGNVAALIPEWMAVLAILYYLGIRRVLNKQAAGGKRVKRRAIRNAPKTELAISAGDEKASRGLDLAPCHLIFHKGVEPQRWQCCKPSRAST